MAVSSFGNSAKRGTMSIGGIVAAPIVGIRRHSPATIDLLRRSG
jgi:hypothetical protein